MTISWPTMCRRCVRIIFIHCIVCIIVRGWFSGTDRQGAGAVVCVVIRGSREPCNELCHNDAASAATKWIHLRISQT